MIEACLAVILLAPSVNITVTPQVKENLVLYHYMLYHFKQMLLTIFHFALLETFHVNVVAHKRS